MKPYEPNEPAAPVSRFPTFERLPVSLVFAALVCSPYSGLMVSYRHSVLAQFLAICLVLCGAMVLSEKGVRSAWRAMPASVSLGLALYAGAATWGLVVGLASGNPLRYVLSQGAAMLLLPIGAMAFVGVRGANADSLVPGFAWAAIFAATIHVTVALSPSLRSHWADGGLRFVFVEGATATGAAVLLVLVLFGASLRRPTLLTSCGLVAALVLLVGLLSRGAWICLGLTVPILSILVVRDRKIRTRLLVIAILAGVGVAGLVVLGSEQPVGLALVAFQKPMSVTPSKLGQAALRARASEGEKVGSELVRRVAFHGPVLEVEIHGLLSGVCRGAISVQWFDSRGQIVQDSRTPWRATAGPAQLRATVLRPKRGVDARVAVWVESGSGSLAIDRAWVSGYRSLLGAWARGVLQRVRVSALYVGGEGQAPNLAYRVRETKAVWHEWRSSSPIRFLVGQGLGKEFDFRNVGWSASGHRTSLPRASYIHDFYLFLMFKLGLAGAVALAGLLLLVGYLFRRALARQSGASHQWFFAAAFSAWIAYLLWSVTSPEIYDFRMAPIWGALVATCVTTEREGDFRG